MAIESKCKGNDQTNDPVLLHLSMWDHSKGQTLIPGWVVLLDFKVHFESNHCHAVIASNIWPWARFGFWKFWYLNGTVSSPRCSRSGCAELHLNNLWLSWVIANIRLLEVAKSIQIAESYTNFSTIFLCILSNFPITLYNHNVLLWCLIKLDWSFAEFVPVTVSP